MAATRSVQSESIQQITTEDVEAMVTGRPLPVAGLAPAPAPPQGAGAGPVEAPTSGQAGSQEPVQAGVGVEGEFTVWEGRYSLKNFLGRLVLRSVVTFAWLGLAYYAWGEPAQGRTAIQLLAGIAGVALLLWWVQFGWQVVYARYSHFYRLTNRRLFVWTGIFRRRIDQLELLKVKDVYIKHDSLLQRMLGLGTVVIESSEEKLPTTYLLSVDQPDSVMDTVWHTSRAERDGKTLRVDDV